MYTITKIFGYVNHVWQELNLSDFEFETKTIDIYDWILKYFQNYEVGLNKKHKTIRIFENHHSKYLFAYEYKKEVK